MNCVLCSRTNNKSRLTGQTQACLTALCYTSCFVSQMIFTQFKDSLYITPTSATSFCSVLQWVLTYFLSKTFLSISLFCIFSFEAFCLCKDVHWQQGPVSGQNEMLNSVNCRRHWHKIMSVHNTPNVRLPSSRQQRTDRPFARQISVFGGWGGVGSRPKSPWSETLHLLLHVPK